MTTTATTATAQAGPPPITVWTTKARELKCWLRAVLPHADRDNLDWMPVLGLVRFEIDGSELVAVATNRYTLAAVRQPVWPAGGRFTVSVSAKALNALLGTVKGAEEVTLSLDSDGVDLDTPHARYRVAADPALGFPDWRLILAELLAQPAAHDEPTGINPDLAALFRTATCGKPEPLAFTPRNLLHGESRLATTRAVVVTCGDWFLGAIANARPRHGWDPIPAPEWTDLLTTANRHGAHPGAKGAA